jgi:hypothetical protein
LHKPLGKDHPYRTAQGLADYAQANEDAKIECARKFFASLDEKQGQDVKYDVVTDYAELMQVGGRVRSEESMTTYKVTQSANVLALRHDVIM